MRYDLSPDIMPVLASFEAHGKRYEIRQLVTGTLVSRELTSEQFTTWPVGFGVETIRGEITKEPAVERDRKA